MQIQQKITPFLGYNDRAQEAAEFYTSILPNSQVIRTVNHPTTGNVLIVEFQLAGMNFVAFNVGETWEFTDAVSLHVGCESQEEIDELWSRLSAGGREVQCGWLKDKFGVSWQIVPAAMSDMLADPDAEKAGRAFAAMLKMIKLDIKTIQQAYDG